MPPVLRIGKRNIWPGEQVDIDLPLPKLYTHTELAMPVRVFCGKKSGARLFISAALHGDEINGVEIIRRVMRLPVLKKLRGTLIAVPVVNVYGFIDRSRYLPDRRDLNRSFPGLVRGSLAARLALLFMEEIVKKSTHGIDFHTGANNRSNLPQIRACLDDPETSRLAHAFGVPLILNADVRDGSLREAVREIGLPVLVYEGGEPLRFDEMAIRAGVKGVLAVMRVLKMLPAQHSIHPAIKTLVARMSLWVRAPASGIFRSNTGLGDRVAKKAVLGWIGDPFGDNEIEVRAPFSGLVIGRTSLPLVNEGDPIYHLASFHKPTSAAAALLAFRTELDPDLPQTGSAEEPPII